MKISKASKVLWVLVITYIGVAVLLGVSNIILGEIMIFYSGNVLLGALILQFIIYTINKFISGYKDNQNNSTSSLTKTVENELEISKDDNKNIITFEIKNDDSWNNIKLKMSNFYKQYNIDKVISDKENSWMLGSDKIAGYLEVKLDKNIITITRFKLPELDMSIIKSEMKESKIDLPNIEPDIEENIDEDILYEQAMNEIENDIKVKALWAKAFANSDGNEEKAKALYIQYRVENLKKNIKNTPINTSHNKIEASETPTQEDLEWEKRYARMQQEVKEESK